MTQSLFLAFKAKRCSTMLPAELPLLRLVPVFTAARAFENYGDYSKKDVGLSEYGGLTLQSWPWNNRDIGTMKEWMELDSPCSDKPKFRISNLANKAAKTVVKPKNINRFRLETLVMGTASKSECLVVFRHTNIIAASTSVESIGLGVLTFEAFRTVKKLTFYSTRPWFSLSMESSAFLTWIPCMFCGCFYLWLAPIPSVGHTYTCLYINVCVYVCMYVCMYVRTYVCMYVM